MKGKGTFSTVDHKPLPGFTGGAVLVDVSSVVRALKDLTEVVREIRPEIRVDLPAMNPTIMPAPVPVSVTVPELPPNPPVSVTVPDFPKLPEYPVIKVPAALVALVCFAVLASNVLAAVAAEYVRTILHL